MDWNNLFEISMSRKSHSMTSILVLLAMQQHAQFSSYRGVASPLSELSTMEWGLVLVRGVDRKLSRPEPELRGDLLLLDRPYGNLPLAGWRFPIPYVLKLLLLLSVPRPDSSYLGVVFRRSSKRGVELPLLKPQW